MATSIRLLGRPSIEVDGRPMPAPRGRKSWAVLAFVVLTDRPPSRRRLAELLFGDANDPLGALRWTLAELRRALGGGAVIVGDPVRLALHEGDMVDVQELSAHQSPWSAVPDSVGELLEGMSFPGCDGFESWLLVERRRHAAAVSALLREAGLAHLGAGRTDEAIAFASRLVELDSLTEAHHTLLVRALAVAGDRRAASEAAERCAAMFERELGTRPSLALWAALDAGAGSPAAPALTGAAAARAQLNAGSAAIAAGAVDAGLDCLRRSVDEARYAGEDALLVTALAALGGALIHSVRGRDEEGASVLHQSLELAATIGSRVTATACRELGFVDVQAGRRDRAERWLVRARKLALTHGDDGELASIDGVYGMSLSDGAHYAEALDVLTDSVARALHCGSRKQAAWSASLVGRLHLLRAAHDEADAALRHSLALVESERWIAFQPWPEAFAAELDLAAGDEKQAQRRLSEAFALACQLGDPCWEGVTARGLAMLRARDDPGASLAWFSDARSRCMRWPDAYQWVQGYVLDAACTVAIEAGDPSVGRLAEELLELGARTGMSELVARAQLHRSLLGLPGAADATLIAAAGIENSALHRRIEETLVTPERSVCAPGAQRSGR